jgi:hypothetical protein
MRYRNPARRITNSLSAVIILIGVGLALTFGSFNLVIFFIALAVAIFVGSLGTLNPNRIYGGLVGAMWMIILALFFATNLWQLFIVGAALSILLGALARPLIALLLGAGIFGLASAARPQQTYYQPPQQPYYQPPQQPEQPYYQPQPYQQGYQPTPQPEGYQEGGQQYQYPQQQPSQYEQPQSQYPQELPPQQ